MKWRTHTRVHGEKVEFTKFAWLPVSCGDGYTRWLCRVKVTRFYWLKQDVKDGMTVVFTPYRIQDYFNAA